MTWNLFLDDIRDPAYLLYFKNKPEYKDKTLSVFKVARSYDEAINLVQLHGCPNFISFDHDLGWDRIIVGKHNLITDLPAVEEKSGYDFAKWLVEQELDGKIQIPVDFSFGVHSSNQIGAANITGLLQNYLAIK